MVNKKETNMTDVNNEYKNAWWAKRIATEGSREAVLAKLAKAGSASKGVSKKTHLSGNSERAKELNRLSQEAKKKV